VILYHLGREKAEVKRLQGAEHTGVIQKSEEKAKESENGRFWAYRGNVIIIAHAHLAVQMQSDGKMSVKKGQENISAGGGHE